ncbi:hypothetical protein ACWIUD_04980 [Helicobacter sp. 23-1044]
MRITPQGSGRIFEILRSLRSLRMTIFFGLPRLAKGKSRNDEMETIRFVFVDCFDSALPNLAMTDLFIFDSPCESQSK